MDNPGGAGYLPDISAIFLKYQTAGLPTGSGI